MHRGGGRPTGRNPAEAKVCAVPRGQMLQGRAKLENRAEDPPSGAEGGTREKAVSERWQEGRDSHDIETEGGECPGGEGSSAQSRGGEGSPESRPNEDRE